MKKLPVLGDKYNFVGGAGVGVQHNGDRWMDGIYQLVMVFEDEDSLLRLLVFETPVTMEERVLFGPVKML